MLDTFSYETLEQQNGQATVVRFQLEDSRYQAGDVVVVLSDGEIHFHGMIGRLAMAGPPLPIDVVTPARNSSIAKL